MAGDWIKFQLATLDKPEVHIIASVLDIDPDAVVGKLLRVWSWFDVHTENGHASVTLMSHLDRVTGVTGFCKAMQDAGWMAVDNSDMSLPHFSRHNGKTAKNRALAAERQSKARTKKVTETSRSKRDTCVTREEKRRIKEKIYKKKNQNTPEEVAKVDPDGQKNTAKKDMRSLNEIMGNLKIAARGST